MYNRDLTNEIINELDCFEEERRAKLDDFLEKNSGKITRSANIDKFKYPVAIVIAISIVLLFVHIGDSSLILFCIMTSVFAAAIGYGFVKFLSQTAYRDLILSSRRYFNEIVGAGGSGKICSLKSYTNYLNIPDSNFCIPQNNYRLNINDKNLTSNYFEVEKKVDSKPTRHYFRFGGQGIRMTHSLKDNYSLFIFSEGFPIARKSSQMSGSEYFMDNDFSNYSLTADNIEAFKKWSMPKLKTVIRKIESLFSRYYKTKFAIIIEQNHITLMFEIGFPIFNGDIAPGLENAKRDFNMLSNLVYLSRVLSDLEVSTISSPQWR